MRNPIIRMMRYKDGKLSGSVSINGTERVIQPFKVENGISASEKEKALLKQAITQGEGDE